MKACGRSRSWTLVGPWLTALALVALPGVVGGQKASGNRPSNNMWTRSAALYLDRARNNPRPDEKKALYEQALQAALQSTEREPDNPRGWFLAGQAYVQLGDYARADSAFDRAESLYPAYVEDTEPERTRAWVMAYNAGVTALQQGNVEEAIRLLESADRISQKRPLARLNLGALYARQGDTEKAIAAYRGALEILRGPERGRLQGKEAEQWAEQEEIATFNLAQLLANAGRDHEAAQAYREYLARSPDNITAKTNLAVVLTRQANALLESPPADSSAAQAARAKARQLLAEAQEIYTELLSRPDLSDQQYFTAGVGLFRAEQHERAAEAFRKALAANPYFRDAAYNLVQSIYARTLDLEKARTETKGEEQKKIADQLRGLYQEMITHAEKIRQLDPNNATVLLLLARAYRGLADLAAAEPKVADGWRAKALEVLKAHEDLPFEVTEVVLSTEGQGKAQLRGQVQNLKLAQGTAVRLRLTLLGKDGAPIGTQEVTVTAPAAKERAPFEAAFETPQPPAGWRYEVLK